MEDLCYNYLQFTLQTNLRSMPFLQKRETIFAQRIREKQKPGDGLSSSTRHDSTGLMLYEPQFALQLLA